MRRVSNQLGAALAVSLVMLGVLTLLGVVAVSLGTTNFRIVGNMEAQQAMESAIQVAIENYVSSSSPFKWGATCIPPEQKIPVGGRTVTVNLTELRCTNTADVSGYTVLGGLPPQNTDWEICGTGQDVATGSTATFCQGVGVRLPNGNCALSSGEICK
jgi:hypothetical protein